MNNFEDELLAEDLLAVYGEQDGQYGEATQLVEMRQEFAPWHHPVKQIVRQLQWADLTKELIKSRGITPESLRYFTLPGEDLLDIKVLADVCTPLGVGIEYLGFNSSISDSDNGEPNELGETTSKASWVTAESALRQAGRITPSAIIFSDRLEDIAIDHSQAASQLLQRPPFDVINIDACDHLTYSPKGREKNTFDALNALLKHQMYARNPWLLFLTTRVAPEYLGNPVGIFQAAIESNLKVSFDGFGKALCECLDIPEDKIYEEMGNAWSNHNSKFLKLYAVGLGKFLLQFFCGQPNLPAKVELVSIYAYRVHKDDCPDMLSLAFRITPCGLKVRSPADSAPMAAPEIEPKHAAKVASRASRLWDIDVAFAESVDIRRNAILGTEALLDSSNYDISAWRKWLSGHSKRPVSFE